MLFRDVEIKVWHEARPTTTPKRSWRDFFLTFSRDSTLITQGERAALYRERKSRSYRASFFTIFDVVLYGSQTPVARDLGHVKNTYIIQESGLSRSDNEAR